MPRSEPGVSSGGDHQTKLDFYGDAYRERKTTLELADLELSQATERQARMNAIYTKAFEAYHAAKARAEALLELAERDGVSWEELEGG